MDKTQKQAHEKFIKTGSMHDPEKAGRQMMRIKLTKFANFEGQPTSSFRASSEDLEMPMETLRRILYLVIEMRTFHCTVVQ